MLMAGLLWLTSMERAAAAVSTTTVQGTVYLANGEPGSGMLHVSWPAFPSANGQAIVASSVDVTIGQDGFLSVKLAPNQGAIPAGLFYTATFYMGDGSVNSQFWATGMEAGLPNWNGAWRDTSRTGKGRKAFWLRRACFMQSSRWG